MDITRTTGRLTASILIYLLTVNPVLAAGLTIDNSMGGNTALDQAGNGVPVINIATPNSQGLSHNRFTDYNVDPGGVVLNNATDRLTQSQLAGFLQNNPNLQGGSASLILNEVTGTQPSQLSGYTEVLGQQAGVIIANPYGITCNGCGFINTPRASLTTGAPQITNGTVSGFDVEGGQIAIEGLGLNGTNTDQFDIITRALSLNAQINARNLNIVTGRNTVTYDNLTATAKAPENVETPAFALDASVLGSMYANSIHLVGTETGLGVRSLADVATSGGDIVLDVNGNLVLNTVSTDQNLQLQAAGDINTTGDVYAADRITLETTKTLSLASTTTAGKRIAIQSGSLNQSGVLAAGVNGDGTLNSTGQLTIQTGELTNTGTIRSSQSLNISAAAIDNRNATLVSDGTLQVTGSSVDNRGGLIDSEGSLSLTVSGNLDNSKDGDTDSVISSQTGNLSICQSSPASWITTAAGCRETRAH